MYVVPVVFAAWAGLGGGLYWLLGKKHWPLWWLVVYGFGTLALFLLWAILSSNKKKATSGNV